LSLFIEITWKAITDLFQELFVLGHSSSGRAFTWHTQGPEFNPQYCKTKQNEKQKQVKKTPKHQIKIA
jgi:hypothetical protein